MFATISCSCCNGASWPDPVMLKLVYIPYVLFSYIIHTHTWVLCPWCVCVCVASVTCVRGQEKGRMRSSPGRAQGLRENKMTEGHMEEERAHTRGHVNAEKIISRLCRPKLETLCRYITRFLATCVCPPIAEGHQRISCLLKPRRRTRAAVGTNR